MRPCPLIAAISCREARSSSPSICWNGARLCWCVILMLCVKRWVM